MGPLAPHRLFPDAPLGLGREREHAPRRVGVDVAERVARAAADGVAGDKRSIWLPRRAFLFGVLTGAPQRIVGPLIAGIH